MNRRDFNFLHSSGGLPNPYYDSEKKVLHWAKDQIWRKRNQYIEQQRAHSRKKGVVVLNAVASMNELGQVQESIPQGQPSFSRRQSIQ